MIDVKCLKSNGPNHCTVFTYSQCPENCKARVTDKNEYIRTLQQMLDYNKGNSQTAAELRKEIKRLERRQGGNEDWMEVYLEDRRRGSGGGGSDKEKCPNKPRIRDNRPVECKWSSAEREEIKEKTKEWEEENGKLEKLSRKK